jgi:p-cumate 2,3-dioxygenase beta subunit
VHTIGRYLHVLVRGASGLMFRERRAVLDLETLRPHGKLSFIL